MIETVGLWMLTAHLLADFPFQPDWMAKKKAFLNECTLCDPELKIDGLVTLLIHVAIHGFIFLPIAYYTLPAADASYFIAWIVGTHFIIDMRRWVAPKDGWGHEGRTWVWLIDQLMHFTALSLAYPVIALL